MTTLINPMSPASSAAPSCGGRLVATDGQELPFLGSALEVDACAGLARVTLRQEFKNDGDEPLKVFCQIPLPADAAVSGYAFTIGDRRVVGEVDRIEAARERFEEALIEGRTSALLEQDRTSFFTQEIGNVPPGAQVTVELTVDQPLRWLEDSQWEWRFPTCIAPRYMGEEGRVADRERTTVDVSEDKLNARATLCLRVRDSLVAGEPSSPSHALHVDQQDDSVEVSFAEKDGAALDRDVVVRWPLAGTKPGLALDLARPDANRSIADSAFGLLAVTPPSDENRDRAVCRDLICLIDTSGSMSGAPLRLAQDVICDVISGLADGDRLELIEFSNQPHRWRRKPAAVTDKVKAAATTWARSLQPGGATEMKEGILAALTPLREDAQRQVLVFTDGFIGFEREIVSEVRARLPRSCRVHTVGIGAAPNRSLIGMVARAGRGGEFIVSPGDEAKKAAERIVARVSQPLIVDVDVDGSALQELAGAPSDLMAGSPMIVPVRLRPEGGDLVVRGRTSAGVWEERLAVPECPPGLGSAAVVNLFGRERVEELELEAAAGENVDDQIEQIGLSYQIATRRTSWVAVSEEPSVDPGEPVRSVRIPQELPCGMSVEGLGLRSARVSSMDFLASEEDSRFFSVRKSMYTTSFRPVGRISEDRFFEASYGLPLDDREDAAMQDSAEPHVPPPPRSKPRVIRGRIVLHRSYGLIVEFEVDEELAWDPPSVAWLEMRDGSRQHVRISKRGTTKPCTCGPHRTIRLVLFDVFVAPEEVDAVCVSTQGEELQIKL